MRNTLKNLARVLFAAAVCFIVAGIIYLWVV